MSLKYIPSDLEACGTKLVRDLWNRLDILLKKSTTLEAHLPGASTNELTHALFNPVAKNPEYKISAVRVEVK